MNVIEFEADVEQDRAEETQIVVLSEEQLSQVGGAFIIILE